MPTHVCDHLRLATPLLAMLIAAAVTTPVAAFSPFSGPIQAASAVPPNVVIMLDNSSIDAAGAGGEPSLAAVGDAVRSLLDRHRHLRFGLFALREALPGEPGPVGIMRTEVGSIAGGSVDGEARYTALNRALEDLQSLAGQSAVSLADSWNGVTGYLGDPLTSPQAFRCQHNLALLVAGDQPGEANESSTGADLEEWARQAWQSDLRRGGVDLAGISWDDPAFPVQTLRTATVALGLRDSYLQRAAAAGRGKHVRDSDRGGLQAALSKVLAAMTSVSGSVGALDGEIIQLVAGAGRHYRIHSDATDWSGSLRAYSAGDTGAPVALLWNTDDHFLPGSPTGHFETWRSSAGDTAGTGITLDGGALLALSAGQQQILEREALRAGLSGSDVGQRLLDWARGSVDPDLRQRNRLLGDVIRSLPLLVGAGHHPLPQATAPGYDSYLARRHTRMPEAVLLGSNDGFVRLFDSEGGHLYSYLPAAAHRGLGVRARPDYAAGYQHRSGVDGRLAVGDVYLAGQWATVAAAGMGAGAKALFALRLFDETAAGPGVLWETDADQIGALGHVYGPPQIAQSGGRAVLILGNGYGSAEQQAALLVLDLISGALLAQLTVSDREGSIGGNGLSTPVLQFDEAGALHAAIAGDLHGQLWKFDLAGNDPARWQVAHAGGPLFVTAPGQPITVQPMLFRRFTAEGDLLLFGTGKLLEARDLADTQRQAFYAVLDAPDMPAGLTPAALQRQQLIIDTDPVTGQRIRRVSADAVNWAGQRGWYLPFEDVPGERVVHEAVVRHARVLFPTAVTGISAADPCTTQVGGWLMTLMLASGGMAPVATLDINGDRRVDGDDMPAAGLELVAGLPGGLSLVEQEDAERPAGCVGESYLVQGSREVELFAGQSQCQLDRIMWRQLQ